LSMPNRQPVAPLRQTQAQRFIDDIADPKTSGSLSSPTSRYYGASGTQNGYHSLISMALSSLRGYSDR